MWPPLFCNKSNFVYSVSFTVLSLKLLIRSGIWYFYRSYHPIGFQKGYAYESPASYMSGPISHGRIMLIMHIARKQSDVEFGQRAPIPPEPWIEPVTADTTNGSEPRCQRARMHAMSLRPRVRNM